MSSHKILTFQVYFPHDERLCTDVHKVLWSMSETEFSQTHQKQIFTPFYSHGVQNMESNRYQKFNYKKIILYFTWTNFCNGYILGNVCFPCYTEHAPSKYTLFTWNYIINLYTHFSLIFRYWPDRTFAWM